MAVYEVFRQEEPHEPPAHAGSVDAPNDALAAQYAREVYSRRGEALRLWVVPRLAITAVEEPDFLNAPIERDYRMGQGYRITVAKRRQLRSSGEQSGAPS